MAYKTILCGKAEGIATITLHRPERRNAFTREMLHEMEVVLDEIAADVSARVVVITGGEKAFSVGADLNEVLNMKTPADFHEWFMAWHRPWSKIEGLPKPVIAAVSGWALGGGCELALTCDLRIASTTAQFGLPEVKLGSAAGSGGTQRLPRLIGMAKAKEMLYTGDPIDAQEAYRVGLVSKVVVPDLLLAEANNLASKMLDKSPAALRGNKLLVDMGMNMDLQSALQFAIQTCIGLGCGEDLQEGVRAFLEKRKPMFTGR